MTSEAGEPLHRRALCRGLGTDEYCLCSQSARSASK